MILDDASVFKATGAPDRARMLSWLKQDGCVCVRGLVNSVEQFEFLTTSWCRHFHQPATRVSARGRSEDGYSSQVSQNGRLLAHAEAYYRPALPPPDICMFWCEVAPAVHGGETSWFDGAEFHDALPPAVAQRMESEGVVYEAFWPPARWQAEFGVHEVSEVRRLLSADHRCRYTFSDSGDLHLFFKVNPIVLGADGRKRFINGILAHLPKINHPRYLDESIYCKPTNRMHWGAGGEIHADVINLILDAHDSVLRKHRWMSGDLLIVDNHRVMHGRESMAEGGERVIFSRFAHL